MSPEAQRIAIAEACGLQIKLYRFWYSGHDNQKPYSSGYKTRTEAENRRKQEIKWGCGEIEEYTDPRLPDYLNNLNAIHDVETITEMDSYPRRERYADYLQKTCKNSPWPFWRATAAQRCEAILKTLGKWVE